MNKIISAYSAAEVRHCNGYLDKKMRPHETRRGEFKFFTEMVRKYGDPVLELGCGACRISMVLAKAGFEVWGLEASPSMIRLAQKALASLPERIKNRVQVVKGDMCNFSPHDFGDKRFPLVIIPYTSFSFNFDRWATKALLASFSPDIVKYGKRWEDLFFEQAENCIKSIIFVLAPRGVFMIDNSSMRGGFWKLMALRYDFEYRILTPYGGSCDVPVLVAQKIF